MWLKSRFTCTFIHICCFYSAVRIHIYPPISISRTTQKYSTPNPRENSQKYFFFPYEINAQVILVTATCYIISWDECSKKIRGNKKGQVPRTSNKRKSEMGGKNRQVSDSRIRGTRYPPERKEKYIYIDHLILITKFQRTRKVCIPSKSKSRVRLSPLLSPSSPYANHSPHMHILIWLIDLLLWIHGLTIQ